VLREHLQRCRALIFPGEEDFGIVPVEAQACGTPVIAFGRGGARETVIGPEGGREPTGLFFPEQTAEHLAESILQSEQTDFHPATARRKALKFDRRRFARNICEFLDDVLSGQGHSRRPARDLLVAHQGKC
jgi:glycosyltransferase involved in cell wall biosynthesis